MTDSVTFLSTQFLPAFIDAYRSHRCLWLVKSRDYSNRSLKTAAYKDLIQLTRKSVPSCDLNFIKKKIEILRGSFRREYRKVVESTKQGAVYKPKLWYYSLLLFLKDEEETTGPPADHVTTAQDCQEVDEEQQEDATLKEEPLYNPAATTMYGSAQKRLRYDAEEAAASLPLEAPLFQEHQREDEFAKFGAVVASKLRRMSAVQEIYAEHLINQVLFSGQLGRLQESSAVDLQGRASV